MVEILVVDDSASIRNEVSEFLLSNGFDVITANDGMEGLQKVKENSELKLVIADFNMPVMDGLTMAEKIREDAGNTEVCILMLTTESNPALKKRGAAAGVKGWILKPIQKDQVINGIKKIVRGPRSIER